MFVFLAFWYVQPDHVVIISKTLAWKQHKSSTLNKASKKVGLMWPVVCAIGRAKVPGALSTIRHSTGVSSMHLMLVSPATTNPASKGNSRCTKWSTTWWVCLIPSLISKTTMSILVMAMCSITEAKLMCLILKILQLWLMILHGLHPQCFICICSTAGYTKRPTFPNSKHAKRSV